MDSLNLRQRLHQLDVRAAQLEGARKADATRNAELHKDVGMAKGRQALGEEVSRVFDALQKRSHERSVGAFERLLSAILNDVLPDEGLVRLLPQFKSNATWLDIALEKNGSLEDVVDGNGGAVTNVVCAGLRFAALSRTDNRRLMILDEPDCWLKPERVPAFVRVVAQVAAQTETQTFFITHHDPSIFEGTVNLVRFTADENNKVHAQALTPQVSFWTDDSQPGVRAIELINVRRHEHTLVPCYPGATAFIGDNNLGKSTAVVTSFKAVAYGESDDTLIRHGCEEARIVFYLEDDQRVEWSRSLKRSPSVIYKLWKGATLVAEGRPKSRNQAPEWVTDVLGVARVDDLDIQVGNQKSPVFLLNDSAPRRAQILSVGRESGHLKTLMKKYDEVKTADRESVKQGELTLARLKVRLAYLAKVEPLPQRLQDLANVSESLLKHLETQEKLAALAEKLSTTAALLAGLQAEQAVLGQLPDAPDALLASLALQEKLGLVTQKLTSAENALGVLVVEDQVLRDLPELPVLADELNLDKTIQRLVKHARVASLPDLAQLPAAPQLHELAPLLATGQRLGQAQKILHACEGLPSGVPLMPELLELERLALVSQRAFTQGQGVKSVETELAVVTKEAEQAQERLSALKTEMGGECPLCGAAFPEQGVEHHVH